MELGKQRAREAQLPAFYKTGRTLSALGAGIGAGIGAVIGLFVVDQRLGRALFAGGGAAFGTLLGYLVGILLCGHVDVLPLEKMKNTTETFGGILSILMAIVGTVGFILTRKWIGITGALFFALCGIYLLTKQKQ